MKILLVFPPYFREAQSSYAPLGIGYLAAYILAKGDKDINVKVIDFTVDKFSPERWQNELHDYSPDILGISVLTLNYSGGKEIARLTRQFAPHTLIVMGGPHATVLPESCLASCDIVVRGEGELTFWEILQGKSLETIKGISFWQDGKIHHNERQERIDDLDSLPFPAHHLFKVKEYKEYPRWAIMSSRGCPYSCTFCSNPVQWERILRLRGPKNVVDEIEYLHKQFNIKHISFYDDNFNIPQRRGIEICEEIVKRGLHEKMSFQCMMRVNKPLVSKELFQKMKQANFTYVLFGVESGSDKVLKAMRKSISLDEARQAIKLAREAKIHTVAGFFMIGNWDEGFWDVIRTWRFVLTSRVLPHFNLCQPLPGTALSELVKQEGFFVEDFDWDSSNQTTCLCRTNKMSRFSISTLYAISIMFQWMLNFTRGGRPALGTRMIVSHAWDKLKYRIKGAK